MKLKNILTSTVVATSLLFSSNVFADKFAQNIIPQDFKDNIQTICGMSFGEYESLFKGLDSTREDKKKSRECMTKYHNWKAEQEKNKQ